MKKCFFDKNDGLCYAEECYSNMNCSAKQDGKIYYANEKSIIELLKKGYERNFQQIDSSN